MNRKKIFAVVLALILVVGAAATLLAPSAESRPAQETTWIYYSSAAKTDVIGEKILTCYWGVVQWGSTSSYYDVYQDPCF